MSSAPSTPKELQGESCRPRRKSQTMEDVQAVLAAKTKKRAEESNRSSSVPAARPKKMPKVGDVEEEIGTHGTQVPEPDSTKKPVLHATIPPPPTINNPVEKDDSKIFKCAFCAWVGRTPTSRYIHMGLQHSVIKPLMGGRVQHSTSGDELFLIPVTKIDDQGNINWAGQTEFQAYRTVLTNASKLDSEGLRQVTNMTTLPSLDGPINVPEAKYISPVPQALLCSYSGGDAIKVHHSGALVYHKKDNSSNWQRQKEGTSSWSQPWNRWWNPSRPQDKEVEKEEEKNTALAASTSVKAADLPPPDLTASQEDTAATAAINAAEAAMPTVPTIDLEAGAVEQLDQMFHEPPELQEASLVETARRQWNTLSGQVGTKSRPPIADASVPASQGATTGQTEPGQAVAESNQSPTYPEVNIENMIWQSLQCIGTSIVGSQSLYNSTLSNQLDLHTRLVALEQSIPLPAIQAAASSGQPASSSAPPTVQFDIPRLMTGLLKRIQHFQNTYHQRICTLEDTVEDLGSELKKQKKHHTETKESIQSITESLRESRNWLMDKMAEFEIKTEKESKEIAEEMQQRITDLETSLLQVVTLRDD
eukprot:6490694-Amphidinium_carterae.1